MNAVSLSLSRVILYVRDIVQVAGFYQEHFGLLPMPGAAADWLELQSDSGGCTIALHRASKAQRSGSAIKLVFGTADVRKFVAERRANGLDFGPIHQTPDFEFANARDPAGNSISVSSRGCKGPAEVRPK